MLTIKQVIGLFQEGLEVKLRRKPNPNGIKGEFDPATMVADVYAPSLESSFDKDITILHEVEHAARSQKAARSGSIAREEFEVELEAVKTYLHRPYVLAFIKQLYRLR